ncbi:MAG: hypothetical protein HDS09_03345 [Bacteroides sp.]|nr:hypothetical protein [Bacteroides sp.]MDE6824195.1 hypothetical protein [Duncaniella sp.]
MKTYRKKLTKIKDRLEKIYDGDNLDSDDIADELDEIMDSLDEVQDMHDNYSLDDFDENLFIKILKLRKEIIIAYDIFDPDIEMEQMGYYDEKDD